MPARRVVSERQLERLIQYMEENRPFAVGRQVNGGPHEKMNINRKWEELATILNSIGTGVSKSAFKWREYWSERKYAVRKKASNLRQYARGTGGGPAKGKLTELEERVLNILGTVAVQGHPSVQIPLSETSGAPPASSMPNLEEPGSSRDSDPSLLHSPEPEPNSPSEEVTSEAMRHPVPELTVTPAVLPPVTTRALTASTPTISHTTSASTPHTRRRPYRQTIDVPQWALEIEERRLSVEEQHGRAMSDRQQSLHRIEAILNVIAENQQQ